MIERLKKIYLKCNDCKNEGEVDYDTLLSKSSQLDFINLANLNQFLHRFSCKSCKGKSFQIYDYDKELLFDSNANVFCEICSLPIPFPRFEAEPNTKKCIDCKNKKETEVDIEPIKTPQVPDEVKGSCKKCNSGYVMVRYSAKNLSFFLSCSRYPKCWWSTNKYHDLLNASEEENESPLEIKKENKNSNEEVDITQEILKRKKIYESKNFFHLENQKSISVKSERWLKYNDFDNFVSNIKEKRSDNTEKGYFINHGFPVTLEEEQMILKMFKENSSIDILEQFFQRSRKTISLILNSNGYKI